MKLRGIEKIMDGSRSREGGGDMKPIILRVCVGIVISASGLILARFVSRKEDTEVTSSASNLESSSSGNGRNDGEEEVIESQDHLKQEILSLQTRFEELQRKENEMELRFERYLKDQEFSKCIDKLETTTNNIVKVIEKEVNDLKDIVATLQEKKEEASSESSNSKPEMVVRVEDLEKDNENEENHHPETSRRKKMTMKLPCSTYRKLRANCNI